MSTDLFLELRYIHYAKSIKILNTLTTGGAYIQPPVVVVEYDELSVSDVGGGNLLQVRKENGRNSLFDNRSVFSNINFFIISNMLYVLTLSYLFFA